MNERTRAYLYRIMGPVEALAIGYGLVSAQKGALWVGLGTALLTNATAIVHTSTKSDKP